MSLGRAAISALIIVCACDASPGLDDRGRTVASVLAKADESFIRTRPDLVRAKYDLMQSGLYPFYRGSYALYLHDADQGFVLDHGKFATDGILPFGIGDAHPENFGTLKAGDGTFGLEPNDFDASDHVPYLYEVRRLAIGMVVATRSSNPEDPEANAAARASERAIAAAVAQGYVDAIAALEAKKAGAPGRIVDAADNPVLEDIFERTTRDDVARAELESETELDASGTKRRLVRGVFDDPDPQNPLVPKKAFEDLPASVTKALPETMRQYRESLIAPPPAAYFAVKDAAREFGAGVASIPRIRMGILVEGSTTSPDDDVVLELKELGDSGARGWTRPDVPADDLGGRVVRVSRTVWSRPDAESLWGVSTLLGMQVQIKGELEAEKGVKVSRLEKDRGTPEALIAIATTLGGLLARMHASTDKGETLAAIAATIGSDPKGFVSEQATVAVQYADVVEGDYARFKKAIEELGPRLGVPLDPADAPDPDQAKLIGVSPDEGTLP